MKCIMAVDDSAMNLKLVESMIKGEYRLELFGSGEAALAYLEKNSVDLILLDLMMPGMDGMETYDRLRELENGKTVPVIFLTADTEIDSEITCLKKGAADFVRKPFMPEVMRNRIRRVLELDELTNYLEWKVTEKTSQIEKMTFETIATISGTIEARDSYTKGHSVRVAAYSVLIAKEAGWSEHAIQNLYHIALLHDIGKVGIPDHVLNKPGRLTEEEFGIIKSHTIIGSEILKEIKSIPEIEAGAKYHHERYNGTGYPCGLVGDEIPAVARIIGIADAFDAMNSKRIYRDKLGPEIIRNELVNGKGTQFDPNFLDIFLRLYDEGKIDETKAEETMFVAEDNSFLMNRVISDLKGKTRRRESSDYLTGLMTRKAGEIKIRTAMKELPGCLIYVDLDNLQAINDTRGHMVGDFALRTTADVLKQYEENGIAVRLEEDKFLLYLTGASKEAAVRTAEEIQEAFDERKQQEETLSEASLSMGLCMCTPLDEYEEVLRKADKALYHVKNSGKKNFFIHERNGGVLKKDKTIDLKKVTGTLTDIGGYIGSLNVGYPDFARMYDFIRHLGERFGYDIQLLVISMEIKNRNSVYMDEKEYIMTFLEKAIQASLRAVDVSTRFSNEQFLVALLNAHETDVGNIVERIFDKFYSIYDVENIGLNYDYVNTEE